MTSILALKNAYIAALRSAEAKDPTIRYRRIKSDLSIALLFNPTTADGMFVSKLEARTEPPSGYYETYPWIEFAETLAQNTANLQKYGWPEYDQFGV